MTTLITVIACLLLYPIWAVSENCGPLKILENSTVDQADNPHSRVLAQMRADNQSQCNSACCNKQAHCSVAIFDATTEQCMLMNCRPVEECITIPGNGSTLVFIGDTNNSPFTEPPEQTVQTALVQDKTIEDKGGTNASTEQVVNQTTTVMENTTASHLPNATLEEKTNIGSGSSASKISTETKTTLIPKTTATPIKKTTVLTKGPTTHLTLSSMSNIRPTTSSIILSAISSKSSNSGSKLISTTPLLIPTTSTPTTRIPTTSFGFSSTTPSPLSTSLQKPNQTESVIHAETTPLPEHSETTPLPAHSTTPLVRSKTTVLTRKPTTRTSTTTPFFPSTTATTATTFSTTTYRTSTLLKSLTTILNLTSTPVRLVSTQPIPVTSASSRATGNQSSNTGGSSTPKPVSVTAAKQEGKAQNTTESLLPYPAPREGVLSAGLIALLCVGISFIFCVFVLLGKRLFDGWQRRHYSRMDYLINGMYN